MDRNSIIGLLLIGAILIGYSYWTRPSEEEIAKRKHRLDSLELVNQQKMAEVEAKKALEIQQQTNEAANITEEERENQLKSAYGDFASASQGQESFTTLENDLIRLVISNKGGRIYSAEIKGYHSYDTLPLVLFDGAKNSFGLEFFASNRLIKTNDLYFQSSTTEEKLDATNQVKSVSFRLSAGENKYIEYVYSLAPNSHKVDFRMDLHQMNDVISSNTTVLDLKWNADIIHQEKGRDNENNYSSIAYKHYQDEVEELSSQRTETEEESISTKVEWVAFKQQFFSAILSSKEAFTNANVSFKTYNSGKYLKNMNADLGLPFNFGSDERIDMAFYFVPNKYKTLEAYEKSFEEMVPLGSSIIRWVNKYAVLGVFNWLEKYIGHMGLIILILTILIKIVIFPLTYKSYVSSAKMRVLKPQVDEINAKFPKKEDAMKKQQAVMELYRKVGVSPLGGCLPLLIQFPILIAMFRFFPSSFELRQQSFLWADDLSTFDAIVTWSADIPLISNFYGNHISLFTLLMAGALVLSTRLNSAQMSDANAQMPGMKFMMNVMMPVMMVFWFNNYAAGLSYYYFLSNLITVGQTYAIRKFIDDKAILAKLEENKKKPQKKSNFQKRLEDMAKQKGAQPKKKK